MARSRSLVMKFDLVKNYLMSRFLNVVWLVWMDGKLINTLSNALVTQARILWTDHATERQVE